MDVRIRVGGAADAAALLAMFDRAVEWLAAHGRGGQWGTEPWSAQPQIAARVREFAAGGGLRVAEVGTTMAGAVSLGTAPRHVPPAAEPELYVEAFVVDRRFSGHGIGAALLERAYAEAAAAGRALLRLDCWAGGDQALVGHYERLGFTPAEHFTVDHARGPWRGRVLTRRVTPPAAGA